MIQVHHELEEAGRVGGLSPLATLRHVIVPLVRPALLNSWFWVALLSYREVTMALVLLTQFNNAIATHIWTLWRDGEVNRVAALRTSLVSLILARIGVPDLALGRRPVVRTAAARAHAT